LDVLETLDALLLDVALEVLELLLDVDALSSLDELLESEPPPQPATVIAPNAVKACRRVK
jgi:hypothetical protein